MDASEARWLVVGLGNPGPDYQRTRHNLGFLVADEVGRRMGRGAWRDKFGGRVREGTLSGRRVVLLKPETWMNESGNAVGPASRFFDVPAGRIVVIHDDVDLDPGRLQVKRGGGDGGHKGVRSVARAVGPEFVRVRIGVGKHPGRDTTDWVLQSMGRRELEEAEISAREAADAVEAVVRDGPDAAMNRWNGRASPGGKT